MLRRLVLLSAALITMLTFWGTAPASAQKPSLCDYVQNTNCDIADGGLCRSVFCRS